MVEVLIQANANLETKNNDGLTPLNVAALQRHAEVEGILKAATTEENSKKEKLKKTLERDVPTSSFRNGIFFVSQSGQPQLIIVQV